MTLMDGIGDIYIYISCRHITCVYCVYNRYIELYIDVYIYIYIQELYKQMEINMCICIHVLIYTYMDIMISLRYQWNNYSENNEP